MKIAGNLLVTAGAALALVGFTALAGAAAYPLKKSANGRYLVDQNNNPFLMVGDSPQALVVNLFECDAAAYFTNRNLHGFNTVWINLLCNDYTGGNSLGSTLYGDLPFTGVLPGGSYDLTKPNETYFAHADRILTLAAQQGLLVLLDPIETGGWLDPTLLDNDTNRCFTYGQFLGNRYKGFTNIIWMSGNDFQDWGDPACEAVVQAAALGIKSRDTNHLHTLELAYYVSSSLDDTNWWSLLDLNATYTYYPTYAQLLLDYGRTNFLPNFMVEANYEFENDFNATGGGNKTLRRQEYWTMLSGAAGQLFGNGYVWQFASGWQTNLDTDGTLQFGYMAALFQPRPWYNLIPDTNHVAVTAGYGTFDDSGSVNDSDYATAARTADGSLLMAYMPTLRTVTVDMSQLSRPAFAAWHDPAAGTCASIAGSPFLNVGSRSFRPAGNNSEGRSDWLLVLDAVPPPQLRIFATPTNTCVVAWPPVPACFALQQNGDLTTTNWVPVTNAVQVVGIENQVVSPLAGQLHFRLKYQ